MTEAHRRRDPKGHWFPLLLCGFMLAAGLLAHGYARGAVGESAQHAPAPGAAAPSTVTAGGPVLNLSGAGPRSFRMPPRTIALTFDGGPDPLWTPQVLDVLRRHGAHATFFVIGAHAADHTELIRRAMLDGNEIGSHTYTHIDMTTAPAWQVQLELNLTQRALTAADIRTRILRMPYSATPGGMTQPEYSAAQAAGQQGYLVALADLDTQDWLHQNAEEIVQAATPPDGAGAVVMMHDSGGDRAQTVRAVDLLITRLSAQGYRFTTLSTALGLPAADVPASTPDMLLGMALSYGQRASNWIAGLLGPAFGLAAALTLVRLVALVLFARVHYVEAQWKRSWARRSLTARGLLPRVSVIVPAYNEEAGLAATVRSLVATTYGGAVEVIIVDDGSTDATAVIGQELARELANVRLIHQRNQGKAVALNTGIAHATHEILVLVDGDTVFQTDTLEALLGAFADPRVGAVSGNTKVANRRGLLGRWQHLEYVVGFNLDRRMFDILQCMPTVPGAIGAFRRCALRDAGGLSTDTLAEDTDLTMAVCRAGWRIVYEETAIAWTEAPSSLRQLWRQRYRWCYGTMQSMWKHKWAIFGRRGSGRIGRRCLPYLTVFQIALPLLAPAVDIYTLYGVIFLNPMTAVATWLAFATAQALASGYALRLDHERLWVLWALPLQQILYRQFMYLVVIQSVVTALLGARLRWHAMHRIGTFATHSRELDRAPGTVPGS
jgi:cellulose synthase/poly-beta-1,6-N-acetylglucosamine synthase-like glycosyltransferase/peptidoglycan/xylan/chitin deacetylase (PgdA/CDA1 family)